MGKIKWILILLLIGVAFALGIYFKDSFLKITKNFESTINEFQKINIDSVIKEVKKEVFTTEPLNIGGKSNDAVFLKSKIIEETNKHRISNSLPILLENTMLYNAAVAKTNDMFLKQYFEHTSPTGIDPGKLVSSYGYEYIITGENLILGNFKSEAEIVQDWMNSPGHRANILNKNYTEIGVAVIKGIYKGETVWIAVQEFGLPLSNCNHPDENLKNKIEDGQLHLEQLSYNLEQKKVEIEKTDKKASYYNQLLDDYNQMVKEYNFLNENLKNFISQYNGQVNAFNNCVSGAQ